MSSEALGFRLASESFAPVGKRGAKDDRGMPGQRVTRAGLGGDRGSVVQDQHPPGSRGREGEDTSCPNQEDALGRAPEPPGR